MITAGSASLRDSPDSRSKLYWLDIEVTFDDILRQERMTPSGANVRLAPSLFRHSVLHGMGAAANPLAVGDRARTFDRFAVDVAAFLQSDEGYAPSERHRSARMVWNEAGIRSPRLEIYVQPKMLRHLVELYVSKRIDTVMMSMKIAIVRHAHPDAGPDSALLPVLDKDGRLYFRRTQCELLSIQASLVQDSLRR